MELPACTERYNGAAPVPPPRLPPRRPERTTTSSRRPQLCAPYDDDIDATLRATEKDDKERPKPDYLRSVHGDQITASARAALYGLAAGTLHRAVSYVDRVLSLRSLPSYADYYQLNLLGAAAVYTAAKYEEQSTPLKRMNAGAVAWYGGFASGQEVTLMEKAMVTALDYRLSGPTAETFVEHFTRYSQSEEELRVQRLARDVADQSLMNYGCLRYLPSMVAAASIFIARCSLNRLDALVWSTELQELTGYSAQDLAKCILTM
uniref:Cyclin-like domain-containing protein n=1 Tax=Leersia perrieri TaxID=77586 RepID=A0A0D9VI09_9ORYZ